MHGGWLLPIDHHRIPRVFSDTKSGEETSCTLSEIHQFWELSNTFLKDEPDLSSIIQVQLLINIFIGQLIHYSECKSAITINKECFSGKAGCQCRNK